MSMPRKRYRLYLDPGSDSAKIPKSTYYRWKRQGRGEPNHVPDRRSHRNRQEVDSSAAGPSTFPTALPPTPEVEPILDNSVDSSENFESQDFLGVQSSMSPPSPEQLHASQLSESEGESVDETVSLPGDSSLPSRMQLESDDFDVSLLEDDSISARMCVQNMCESVNLPSSELLTPEALNEPLVPTLSVTKFETLLMIFHLVMRHGMTGVLLEDMLKYTNTLVGDNNAIPGSKYLFHKLFMTGKSLQIHFYCPKCESYLGPSCIFMDGTVDCNKCKVQCTASSMNNGNFFIALSIKDQLENFLKRKDINMNYPLENRPERSFSDIYDGHIYKALQDYCKNHDLSHPLTLTFNTDGSPVYKSPKNSSLWPIQFLCNEVDRKERFNVENVMLAGLWFGSNSPLMNVFFKPFVSELKTLRSSGVTWTLSDGKVVQSPVFALCCCTDSVAKPKVQKHHQFNGKFGCGYCLHPGRSTVVNDETGFTNLRYVADDNYPYRTDKSLRQHMREASMLPGNAKEKHVYGSLGVSPLISLPLFNLVFGFGIDFMHMALEGVMSKLCELWFARKNHDQEYYIGDQIDLVDKRMSNIAPPSSCRVVRGISDRVHYKANEWRNFLFFYALPCLKDVLPGIYYSHFQKFASAMHIFLRESFTYDEMQKADFLLYDFVWDYGDLYGENNMVYNVHLLLHCGKIVTMLGPMWGYSAFCFESGNGRLVKLVKGTTGVATQIVRKYHMAGTAGELVVGGQYTVTDRIIDFCNDVATYKELKSASKVNGVVLLGTGSILNLLDNEKEIISNSELIPQQIDMVVYYNRVIKSGVLYHGKRYSGQKRHDDSCVKFQDGTYAVLDLIFTTGPSNEQQSDVWCFAKKIRFNLEENDRTFPSHIKQACADPYHSLQLYPFDFVEKKCVLMNCDTKVFVAEFPNTLEKD